VAKGGWLSRDSLEGRGREIGGDVHGSLLSACDEKTKLVARTYQRIHRQVDLAARANRPILVSLSRAK